MMAASISTPPTVLLIAMTSFSSPYSLLLVFLFVPVFLPIRSPGRGLQRPQSEGQVEYCCMVIALEQLQGTCPLDPARLG